VTDGLSVRGIRTGLLQPGEDIVSRLLEVHSDLMDGDIVVIAESALATAEGRIVRLPDVTPSEEAVRLASKYSMDPRFVQVVLDESDRVVGGITGTLLCIKGHSLLPNAGVDSSNAPPDTVVLLPEDPNGSARRIREKIYDTIGVRVGVIIADSRVHPMRLGCSGVALGSSGLRSVIDERGKPDLFGRPLEVTRRAVADCIASTAELIMGEGAECIPVVVVRGLDVISDREEGISGIDPSECLFMGTLLTLDPDSPI